MSTATTEPTTRAAARPVMSPLRQTLRLTRTEFTLFMRYKTAWMFLGLAVFMFLVPLNMPGDPVVGDITTADLALIAALGSVGLIIGIGHPSNVFTARRESLVLKQMRVSGVPRSALFGSITLMVVLMSLAISVLGVVMLAVVSGALPKDPVMLLLSVLLSAVSMSFLGLLITPLARTAESAQMTAMVPMMFLLFTGGNIIPTGMFPDRVVNMLGYLPTAAAGRLAQASYTGYDVFSGYESATPAGILELWVAALPTIGILLAWSALFLVLTVRYFRWDPRQP
ncbi:ABC transporter permease [Nocardiopsis sp. N85]|uniref:ABC transporter permease n=1 Tax=Nocardiopsis sp. N85 TaxID=3029400 RepID=UPI00237EEC30|nr:ABC transporter permease [Nocardiopsis sp. N85]MDE3723125.1 ABC transporter permease [Nocardiopsis sp. N85]